MNYQPYTVSFTVNIADGACPDWISQSLWEQLEGGETIENFTIQLKDKNENA